jgi:hypothetical protein
LQGHRVSAPHALVDVDDNQLVDADAEHAGEAREPNGDEVEDARRDERPRTHGRSRGGFVTRRMSADHEAQHHRPCALMGSEISRWE